MKKISLRSVLCGGITLRISAMFCGLATTALLARLLGVSDFGLYSYLVTIVSILAVPAQFGASQLAAREVAKSLTDGSVGRVRYLLKWLFTINAAFAAISTLGFAVFICWFVSVSERVYYLLSLPAIYLLSLNQIRSGFLQGLGKIFWSQLPDLLVRPLLVLIFVVFLSAWMNLSVALITFIVGLFLSVLVGTALLSKGLASYNINTFASDRSHRSIWLSSIIPLGAVSAIQVVNSYIDILLVGAMLTKEDVGLYKVATQFATVILFGERAIQAAVMPMVASANRDAARIRDVTRSASILSSLFSAAVLLFLYLCGEWLIKVLVGIDYLASHPVMLILGFCYLFSSLIGSGATVLVMSGYEAVAMRGAVIAVLVNVVLSMTLIPMWGINGVAIATLIAIAVSKIYMSRFVRRELGASTGLIM